MSGLLRRLTRRRPATADENRSATAESSEPAGAPADAPAEPGGDRPVPAADEQQTQVLPETGEHSASPGAEWAKSASAEQPTTGEQATGSAAQSTTGDQPTGSALQPTTGDQPTALAAQPAPVRDLPAGVDPGDLAAAPAASARRGKLRRRLRYLRHVRELLLRDLGGFTYEVHRTAGGTPQDSHRRLSEAKAKRISAIDAELGVLETQLGEPHAPTVLREAGIGGTCPECGELHASDARYCARCGAPLDEKARAQREAAIVAAAAQPTTGSHATVEPQPASVLWAGGPHPSAKPEEEAEEKPAAVTGEWLRGTDQPTTFDRAAQPDEPAADDEPAAKADDAVAGDETAATPDEPVAADEPVATDEPAAEADEPAKVDETAKAEEPVAGAEPAAADGPAAKADEPAASDESAAKADETVPADDETTKAEEPVAGDETAAKADEAAAKPEESPAADAPAKPKRARRSRKPSPAPDAADPEKFEPGPNGRRDEDVPPPISSGDPLTSRREQRP